MAKIIKVTITGGAALGPQRDNEISIDADNIISLEDVIKPEIGTSKITMIDKTEYYVSETREELSKIIND